MMSYCKKTKLQFAVRKQEFYKRSWMSHELALFHFTFIIIIIIIIF